MCDGRWFAPWLLAFMTGAFAQEDYSFDVEQFQKKSFEWSGYVEARPERAWLDRDSALAQLNFFDQTTTSTLDRAAGALELSALYRRGMATVQGTVHSSGTSGDQGSQGETRLYEGYLTLQPATGARLEAGKRALRWGKSYAFNPLGFVERPKDPNDPELSREGFVMLGGNFIRSFEGPLTTLSLTPLLVPTGGDLNEEFGEAGHLNPAAKLTLLYRDTDIDFLILGEGARSLRYGVDFSRNLTTNFELHGEWAHVTDAAKPVLLADGNQTIETADTTSHLLGLRYLTERDTTWIAEYYHNGAGYTEGQMRDYFTFVHDAYDAAQAGDTAPIQRATALADRYARANPMRNYLYLRVSRKEPFDILYFNTALTLIQNLDDGSRSLSPELSYTGITNLELRLRAVFLAGNRLTDFGEKQNDRRLELRARYYF